MAADNVVIHQITDQQQQAGESLEQVLADLLQAIAGKVMLVHYHQIEQRFLQQACKQLYGIAPPLLMIDTLLLAKRRLDRRDIAYDPSSLRLANLRRHFQLPDYYAHNALSDAIATAEVYLAETNHYADKVSLREVLV